MASQDPVAQVSQALAEQHPQLAIEQASAALRHSPKDVRLWTLQALALAQLGKTAAAVESYRHALRIAPSYSPALQGAAQLAYATHSPEAEPLLHRVLALQPQESVAHAMLGELAFRRNDCEAASLHFSQAGPALAGKADVLLQYSSCLFEAKQYAGAVPVLRQAVALSPGNRTYRYDLALAQWNAEMADDAMTTIGPDLRGERPLADELTLAAAIAEGHGETQQAVDLLRRATLLYPTDINPYLEYANLTCQHSSYQVGINVLDVGIRNIPDAAQLYFARGVLRAQLTDINLAIADFDLANQLDPKLSFVGIAQGIAQSEAHYSEAALERFRAGTGAHPRDALSWYLLAEALSETAALPGTPEYQDEVAAAERAAQLDPKRADAQVLLATIYLRANKIEQAIIASQNALAAEPDDQQAIFQLMMALRRSNKKERLPELAKRLDLARTRSAAKTERERPHILVEQANTPARPAQTNGPF